MAKETLGQVVKRAISDVTFRRQLQSDPEGALKGFDLTGDERAALRSGDASKLSSLGIDQRMSKTFEMGAGASVASKWASSDVSLGMNVPDGGALPLINDALAQSARSASDTLIDGGSDSRAARSDSRISDARSAVISGITSEGTGVRSVFGGDQHDGGRSAIGGDPASSGRSALGDQHDISRASVTSSDVGGRQTDAFITADETGSDVTARRSASYPDSADTQREALSDDAAMANPEGYDQPDPNAA